MRDLLTKYYVIQVREEKMIEGKSEFNNDQYHYFTISADNNKAIYDYQSIHPLSVLSWR